MGMIRCAGHFQRVRKKKLRTSRGGTHTRTHARTERACTWVWQLRVTKDRNEILDFIFSNRRDLLLLLS